MLVSLGIVPFSAPPHLQNLAIKVLADLKNSWKDLLREFVESFMFGSFALEGEIMSICHGCFKLLQWIGNSLRGAFLHG